MTANSGDAMGFLAPICANEILDSYGVVKVTSTNSGFAKSLSVVEI